MNPRQIQQFIRQHRLPDDYADSVTNAFRPLQRYLQDWAARCRFPLLIGINGAQGTGKSTLANYLATALQVDSGIEVAILSIDDFYLAPAARQRLAEEVHPLLLTRGVPGTHDLVLLNTVVNALLQGVPQAIAIPRFDKATDNPLPRSDWQPVTGAVQIILFEGWFVGARAQTTVDLHRAVNKLEALEDEQRIWRSFVNAELAGSYQKIFNKLDRLIMLKAPCFEKVFEWRLLQESRLAEQSGIRGTHVMNEEQLQRFISHFERLTRHCLATIPAYADIVVALDEEHRARLIPGNNR